MRVRRKWVVVGVITVVAIVVMVGITVVPSSEPSYQGKRLSEWVDKRWFAPQPGFPQPVVPPPASWFPIDAEETIREIGTKAIPYLLKWIRYEPPVWKTKLFTVINRMFRCSLEDQQAIRADTAASAVAVLGSEAVGAVPGLALLMNDTHAPNRARRATSLLSKLQSELLPAAMALMTNNSGEVRLQTVYTLSVREKENSVAVPILIQGLQDTAGVVARGCRLGTRILWN